MGFQIKNKMLMQYIDEGETDVVIPDNVTKISGSAFEGCKRVQSVIIPDGVTSIGISAFKECSSLRSVTIPDSVIDIGSKAFYGTPFLEKSIHHPRIYDLVCCLTPSLPLL